jgi:Rps23 Pro-64 3,4-dihydroxylase Tpa1-like proline 4-hydroxylase
VTSGLATPFYFDSEALLAEARERADRYRTAWPFPHAVIDDLLPLEVARACEAEFEQTSREQWQLYTDAGNTKKLEFSDERGMGPLTRQLIAQFNGRAMIEFLEELTGIGGLVGDPHLLGGGLHELGPGGFLRVHADFNVHPLLRLDRRINLLLYLNEGWESGWGGELELWDAEMRERADPIAPALGRVVIFNVTDRSYHGNPNVVACPPGRARRSLAFYYYSNGRPLEERSVEHSTLYQTPGESPVTGDSTAWPWPARARRAAKEWVPPVLVRAFRRARGR